MTETHSLTMLGSILLSVCGLPQAIKAKKDPYSTRGLSWYFLGAWLLGEMAMGWGLFGVVSWPVLANYVANVAMIVFIAWTKGRYGS